MFGSHLSISGGLHNALIDAQRLGLDCVQIFTKNQRQWACPPLPPEAVQQWESHKKSTGITQVVSHDTYLVNLASSDEAMRRKSMGVFRHEIQRCQELSIPWLVSHPGAHMGAGEEAGLKRVIDALDAIHKELPGYKTLTCIEITAGQGTSLGWRIEHLAAICQGVADPKRVGVCIDTAHSLEAGYDLTSAAGAKAFIQELDDKLGLTRVKVLHLNDSKTPRGSRVDRHQHIGQGHVALEAFEVVVNQKQFRDIPKIMETPKETAPDGREWDSINVELLRSLIRE